ncbi:MAG: TolC family protein [Verrucomicrobiota bacterium]
MKRTMADGRWPNAECRVLLGGLTLLLVGLPALVRAEENNPTVSPERVVADALAYSPVLKLSDQEVAVAQAQKTQADAQAFPSLSLDAHAGHYEGLTDSALGPGMVIPAIPDRYGAAVRLSQPVYTGGRIGNEKKGANYQRQAVRETRRSTESDLALQALTAYWNWSKAYYSLEALKAATDRMAAHATDMHNLHAAGLATDNDALATDVLLDQTRLRLEEARRRTEVSRARITFLTCRELPGNAVPQQAAVPPGQTVPPEVESLGAAASNRPDRAAGELEAKSSEAAAKASRAGLRPQLFLTAHYEQANPNILNIPPADEWQDDTYVGVAVTWNLLDWGLTRARASEAAARATQAHLRLQHKNEQITLEVKEAGINLKDALERVTVAERAELSATRNLAAATDLWKNGLARHSDVLDAHAQLTEAQNQVIAARADVALARAGLDHAMGLLRAGKP